MKKIYIVITVGLLLRISTSYGQAKTHRFCQVDIRPKNGMTTKLAVSISFGDVDSLFTFKDPLILQQLKKVDLLPSQTDVLNYMSSIGWHLVTIVPYGLLSVQRLYFKREFDQTEIK